MAEPGRNFISTGHLANAFAGTGQLPATPLNHRHKQTARPFNWKPTAADLTQLLHRISASDEAAQQPKPTASGHLMTPDEFTELPT